MSVIIKIGDLDAPFFPVCQSNYANDFQKITFAHLLSEMKEYGKVFCNFYRAVYKCNSYIILETNKGYSFSTAFNEEIYREIFKETVKLSNMASSHEKTLYTSIIIPEIKDFFENRRDINGYIPKITFPYYELTRLNSNKFCGWRIRVNNYFGEKETLLRNSVGKFSLYKSDISYPPDSDIVTCGVIETHGMKIKYEKGYFHYYIKSVYF